MLGRLKVEHNDLDIRLVVKAGPRNCCPCWRRGEIDLIVGRLYEPAVPTALCASLSTRSRSPSSPDMIIPFSASPRNRSRTVLLPRQGEGERLSIFFHPISSSSSSLRSSSYVIHERRSPTFHPPSSPSPAMMVGTNRGMLRCPCRRAPTRRADLPIFPDRALPPATIFVECLKAYLAEIA